MLSSFTGDLYLYYILHVYYEGDFKDFLYDFLQVLYGQKCFYVVLKVFCD